VEKPPHVKRNIFLRTTQYSASGVACLT
jgi:hypothetical protein